MRGDGGHGRERKQVRGCYTETLAAVVLCDPLYSFDFMSCLHLSSFCCFCQKNGTCPVYIPSFPQVDIIFLGYFQWHKVFDFVLVFIDSRNNGGLLSLHNSVKYAARRLIFETFERLHSRSLSKLVSGLDVICFLLFESMHIHQEGLHHHHHHISIVIVTIIIITQHAIEFRAV